MEDYSADKTDLQFRNKEDVYKAFGLIGAVYFVVMFTASRPLHKWVFTQWMFSYEFEFVKRALHGEIFRLLGIDISYTLINAFVFALIVILNVMLILLFSHPVRRRIFGNIGLKNQFSVSVWANKPIHIGLGLFFLMALLHSTTLQRFFQFPGYLEHLQLLLVLGALYALCRTFRSTARQQKYYHFLIVGAVCFTSLFIHEAFLFFYLPMIFMYWFYEVPGGKRYNALRFLLLTSLIFLTWVIGTYGLLSADQYQMVLSELVDRFGSERVDLESYGVLFRGFSANLEFTWNWFGQRLIEKSIHLGCTIIILSPTAYVFWKLYEDDFFQVWGIIFNRNSENQKISTPKNSALRVLLILSCCTPLMLIPIGIDIFRWISISTLNMFIITFILMFDNDFEKRVSEKLFQLRFIIGLVIALSLIFGTLGITNSFSWVYKLTTNLGFGI